MSVIIDMDMPDKCEDCEFFWCEIDQSRYYRCQITKNYIDEKDINDRPNHCPLKELVTCNECKYWHKEFSTDGLIEYINYSRCKLGYPGNGNVRFCPEGEKK